jgi:phosphoserine phosphatase
MGSSPKSYRGLVSSDWNECLAPCGPFDPLIHAWPELEPDLQRIFRSYTGNEITLGHAAERVRELLPEPLPLESMDRYLESRFATYRGLPELLAWCRENGILVLINTTGFAGYFQRALALGLLPPIDALSAHPLVVYPKGPRDPQRILELRETEDKGLHTEKVLRAHGIPPSRAVVVGDSGGDGPHFAWAAANGACTVGSMTKPSLQSFLERSNIRIDHRIGPSYAPGEPVNRRAEMEVDLMELSRFLTDRLLT